MTKTIVKAEKIRLLQWFYVFIGLFLVGTRQADVPTVIFFSDDVNLTAG